MPAKGSIKIKLTNPDPKIQEIEIFRKPGSDIFIHKDDIITTKYGTITYLGENKLILFKDFIKMIETANFNKSFENKLNE